jgi:hypothetical protein
LTMLLHLLEFQIYHHTSMKTGNGGDACRPV